MMNLLLALLLVTFCSWETFGEEIRVYLSIINHTGAALELYWINEIDGNEIDGNDLISMLSGPLINGSSTKIYSSVTHKFLLKFAHNAPLMGEVEITKGPNNEILTATHDYLYGLRINQETNRGNVKSENPIEILLNFKDNSTIISESSRILEENPHNVTERMIAAVQVCSEYKASDNFDLCIMNVASFDLEGLEDRKVAAMVSRKEISSRLRNYTCEDNQLESSPALYSISHSFRDKVFDIDVLFETSHAKIWVVHNFISTDQCEILKDQTESKLTKATVAAADGSSIYSIHRKAQQARYHMNKTDEKADALYSTYNSVFDITNRIAGYDLKTEGQEGIMVIQYNKDDQYTPHCDGDCDGNHHSKGGRVATAVVYCQVPMIGGGTTFTHADVFVKPTAGMATFFSYKGPDNKMEEGFTEHSGCPVIEGEKWIGTVWMREGVSAEEPEHLFDPAGQRLEGVLQEKL